MEVEIELPQTRDEERRKDRKQPTLVQFPPVLSAASYPIWTRPQNSVPLLVHMPSGERYVTVPEGSRQIVISPGDAVNVKRRSPGNGLRHFATRVMTMVEQKQRTTYNEIADQIVHDVLSCSNKPAAIRLSACATPVFCEEKNIRRRVYDALNVLLAMKIIHKDKKLLRWTGMPSTIRAQHNKLENDKAERVKRITKKKKELTDLVIQLVAFKSLISRNRARQDSVLFEAMQKKTEPELDREVVEVKLPFIVVNTIKETAIDCWISADRRAFIFNFDHQFEIHDDIEVLRRMGLTYGIEKGHLSTDDLTRILPHMPSAVHRLITDMVSDNVSSTRPTQLPLPSTSHSGRPPPVLLLGPTLFRPGCKKRPRPTPTSSEPTQVDGTTQPAGVASEPVTTQTEEVAMDNGTEEEKDEEDRLVMDVTTAEADDVTAPTRDDDHVTQDDGVTESLMLTDDTDLASDVADVALSGTDMSDVQLAGANVALVETDCNDEWLSNLLNSDEEKSPTSVPNNDSSNSMSDGFAGVD